jgi:hypothetical protein
MTPKASNFTIMPITMSGGSSVEKDITALLIYERAGSFFDSPCAKLERIARREEGSRDIISAVVANLGGLPNRPSCTIRSSLVFPPMACRTRRACRPRLPDACRLISGTCSSSKGSTESQELQRATSAATCQSNGRPMSRLDSWTQDSGTEGFDERKGTTRCCDVRTFAAGPPAPLTSAYQYLSM